MAGPSLSSSSPLDNARQQAITRTTRTILDERATARAAQAASVLGQARASSVTPETAARVSNLRNSAAIPGDLRVTDTQLVETLEDRVERHREQRLLRDNPRTADWFLDYDNAVSARDSVSDVAFFEGLGNSLARGGDRAVDGFWLGNRLDLQQEAKDTNRDAMMSLSELVEQEREKQEAGQAELAGREARGRNPAVPEEGDLPFTRELSARSQGFWRYLTSGPTRLFASDENLQAVEKAINDDLAETLADIAFESAERQQYWPIGEWRREIEQKIADNPGDTAVQGFVNILNIARDNPGRFAQYMMEVSAESGVTIGAGVAVGAATRSPALAALTMGSGSAVVGQEAFFEELVGEYGYDISTPEGRSEFLEDPRVLRDLRDKSKAYGITIGILDAASGGVAGKALLDNPVGDMVAQMIVQALAGGSGEALGRVAAGEDVDWNEVIIEALAETITAPWDIGGMALSGAQRRVRGAQNEAQQRKLFDILSGKVKASQLKKRDRARYAAAIKAVTADGPAENVHIDPEAMSELFQSDSATMSIEEFFDAVPELDYREFQEARDSGSQYVIPTSVYAASIAGNDIDAMLRPHIKLRPDDMSQAEVETFQADLVRTQAELAGNVDKMQTVIGELEGPLAQEMDRLRSEIVQAHGIRPQDAERQAAVLVASARAGAARAGMTVSDYLRRYTLPTIRNADTVGPVMDTPVVSPDVVLDLLNGDVQEADSAMPEMAAIRDRLDRNGVEDGNASREDVIQAVKELVDEGGITATLPEADAARPGSLDRPGDGDEYMQTATLRGGQEDMSEWGIDPTKRNKTRDIALKLQERQRKLYGKISRKNKGPKTIDRMAEWMADELEFELQTPERSGLGWYGPKFQAAIDQLGAIVPALISEEAAAASKIPGVSTVADARAVMTALFAVSSNGTKVVKNVDNAINIMVELHENGEITPRASHRVAINGNIETLLAMAEEMGGVGMQEHLTREVTMSEINKELRSEGKSPKGGYPADMVVPFAAKYLGPKLSAFYANLTGATGYLTMDLWWTRSIRRYQGDVLPKVSGLKNEVDSKGNPVGLHRFKVLIGRPDLTDRQALNYATEYAETYARKDYKNGTEAEKAANTLHKAANLQLDEAPSGAAERTFMIKVVQAAQAKLAERTGITYDIADIQAMLWYYEKRLYAEMGVRDSGDLSYEEAAEQVVRLHSRRHNGGPRLDGEFFQEPLPVDLPDNTLMGPDGSPVRLYHSTNQSFDAFDDGRIMFSNQSGFVTEHALTRYGFDPNIRVIEATVAFDNEITFEAPSGVSPDGYYHRIADQVEEALTTGGHDGAVIYNPEGEAIVIATTNDQVRQLNKKPPRTRGGEFFQGGQATSEDFADMRKAVLGPVTIADFDPNSILEMTDEERLALFKRPGWFIVTAARTEYGDATSPENEARADTLREMIEEAGYDYAELEGVYKGTPDGAAFLVIGPEDDGFQLGADFGQESILTSDGLVFTDGSGNENVPFSGIVYGWDAKYEDFRSTFKGAAPVHQFSPKLDFPAAPDVTVDDGDGTSHYGARVEADGTMLLTHWSTAPLDVIDPQEAGTGALPGPERNRRGPRKSFFGLHIGTAKGYKRESGKLGQHRHEVRVDPREMYPWWDDPDGLKAYINTNLTKLQQMEQYEELIKDAGYKGYFVIDGPLGDAAVTFEAVEVDARTRDNDARAIRSSRFNRWFRASNVVNPDGSPMMVFHGTAAKILFNAFRPWSHFGTSKAAQQRMDHKMEFHPAHLDMDPTTRGRRTIPAYLSIQNPLDVGVEGGQGLSGEPWETTTDVLWQVANVLGDEEIKSLWRAEIVFSTPLYGYEFGERVRQGDQSWTAEMIDREYTMGTISEDTGWTADQIAKALEAVQQQSDKIAKRIENAGYDGIVYTNIVEDKGSKSYITFRPEQVKSPFNTGEWDLNNPDILYQGALPFPESEVQSKVYHRTGQEFDDFQLGDDTSGRAIWFVPEPDDFPNAHNRTSKDRVVSAYVDIRNPLYLDEFNLQEMQERYAGGSKEFPFYLTDETRQRLLDAGFDGVISEDIYGDGEVSELFVLDPSQVRIDDPRAITLSQSQGQGPFGSIILPKEENAQAIINLFEGANMTTMLHETGHFFLWQLQKQAADGLQFAIDELEVVRSWLMQNSAEVAAEASRYAGSEISAAQVEEYLTMSTTGQGDVDKAVHRAMHEQFARGFEAYTMEGKSPSNALRSIFESFSAWLLSWYKSVKALNVNINDDIRGVFDRLVAIEEEMMTAEDRNVINDEIAETAKAMGLDEDNYRRLVALSEEAREEGRQLARRELLATEKKMRSREYQARYAEIEEEERERINSLPVNRAIQWLAYGRWLNGERPKDLPLELRLDTEMLIEDYGREILDQLPRGRHPVYAKDTLLQADEVAGWFGFDSGATMVDALIKAPKANEAIKAATQARAQKELGDPMTDPDSVAQAADDAQHGEKRGQVIVAELRAMNRLGGKKKKMTTRAQAKVIARELIQRMPVREALQTTRYLAAERKHAEDAARALAAGDVDAAFAFKRKQLIQHELYIESRKAAELTQKAENLAGRLKRKGTRENLAPEYLGAIDDVLETYDFRKISGKAEVRRTRLQAYVQGMKAQGRDSELAIPDSVLNESRRIPYKQLEVRRLQGVYDTLKNIEHTARRKQKLRLAQQERELQEVRDEISGAFTENIIGKPINRIPTWVDRKREGIQGYFNLVRNADTILRKIDGWANRGVMARFFKEDIDAAGTAAKEMRDQATRDLDNLFSSYSQKERRQMAVRRKWDGYDQGMSKWDIISIALNMGNKDNLERLTSRDSRGALTRAEVDALVDNLDKRDWDFVQAVWNYLDNTYWPLIAERERRATGVTPTKVEAAPVQTKFGEYRGGYYPIVYDRRYSAKVTEDQNADLMQSMMAGRFGKAQTRNGHTKERAQGGGGRTVQLGMQVLFGHVNNVIHDLAFGEAVNNAWKLLQDEQVKGEFEKNGMLGDHQALELWVKDVAAGPAAGSHALAGLMRRLKSGFTLSKLAFNMSTVAIQVTGLTQSAAVLGTGNMLKGMSTYLFSTRGRIALANDIKERSTFMREREETFQRDAYDMYSDTQLDPLGGRLADAQKLMMGAGFFAMQKVQYYAVDVPTWLAAHQKGLADGMTETDAANFADRMVARAQASGLFADRTAIERGTLGPTSRQNEFVRLFTALGSYMFAKYNVAEEVVGRTVRDIRDPGRNSVMAVLKATSDMMLLFTLEAILYHLIRGSLPGMDDEDDEGWGEFLAEETALSVASIFPFIRDVSSAVQGYGGGGAYGGVSETVGRMISAAGDVALGEATAADARSLNEMVGLMVVGYPSTAAWRLIDGVGATGEEPSALSVIMGR